MHEKRNLLVVVLLIAVAIWAFIVWFISAPVMGPAAGMIWMQRIVAVVSLLVMAGLTFYVLNIEDKMVDLLATRVGAVYYDVDGLSFMPTVRVAENRTVELSLYYQNRFENYCQAIIHLRLPGESFIVGEGIRDLHFAFKADGGDFGVIHQPITVPRHLQGAIVPCKLAAAVRFPRSHGARMCSHEGLSCGSFAVDWGQAFKVGVHEVSGEIDLRDPCTVNLSMPLDAGGRATGPLPWKQELIHKGPSEAAVLG